MSPRIEVIETKLFEVVVADEIVSTINDAIAERGFASVAMAGGSTPGSVYRTLARPPRVEDVPWEKVKLFMGDERWVPNDDPQSNYRMVVETLTGALDKQPKLFAVATSSATPEEAAAQYGALLRKELATPTGLPVLDLVLLGIGEDGHTASIFPGSPLIHVSPGICCASKDASGEKPRITFSKEVLFGARRVMFIVKGAGKAAILKRVLEGNESADLLPSRLYCEAPKDSVVFYLDTAAAAGLDHVVSDAALRDVKGNG